MKIKPLILSTLIIIAVLTTVQPPIAYAESGVQRYGAVHRTWITPTPNNPGAEFSNAIAIHGDTLVVGARYDQVQSGAGTNYYAGAAYVYQLDGVNWTLQARLTASDPEAGDLFGSSVDIYQDTIVVGAVGSDSTDENGDAANEMGAAYVFTRSGEQWQQQAKIQPEDGIADDNFGNAVSLVGERIVVGASAKDIGTVQDAGKVYSFYRNGTKWYQAQSITAPNVSKGAFFGASLDYDGLRVVVGAQDENDIGAAYIFYRTGSTWSQEEKIEPDDDQKGNNFGASVSIDGETVAVGAPFSDPNLGLGEVTNAGAVYVYHRKAAGWYQQDKLVLADAAAFDHFGESVKIDDTTIVVGATGQDYYNILRTGAAFVYQRKAGIWELQTKIISGEPAADGDFGASITLDDTFIYVGEPGKNSLSNAGSVHLYTLEAGTLPSTGYAPGVVFDPTIARQTRPPSDDPIQLEIPSLSVDAQIISAPKLDNSWDVKWLAANIGHLEGTAYPTHSGNSVLAGHVNLPDGTPGPFADIEQLKWGDEIVLQLGGIEYIYEVRHIYETSPTDLEVLDKSDGYDWLTLITCSDFDEKTSTYNQRIIVEAVRVK